MKKGRTQNILMIAAVAVLVYLLFTMNNKSEYSIKEREYSAIQMAPSNGPTAAGPAAANGCGMENGVGLASSLLPREVASAEDFGEFAPEDILAGQNFLEPRSRLVSPRLSVVPSAMPINRSDPIPLTPRIPSSGTTLLSSPI